MKTFYKTYLTSIFLLVVMAAVAQTSQEKAKTLVKDGVALHNAGKFTEAIEKYDQAIKVAPGYDTAYFEKGFTLSTGGGKPKEAVRVLEKLLKINPQYGEAYDLLGTIYAEDKQTDKAIEYYTKGIEAAPKNKDLHFGLGKLYIDQKKFAEAEACLINAIKIDPKDADSMLYYALVTYQQQKNDRSLLAWCSFILLEFRTDRAKNACVYVKDILNNGIKKNGGKAEGSGGQLMPTAVLPATQGNKGFTITDSLSVQLKSAFQVLAQNSAKSQDALYTNYFARYFGELAKTNHMPAFARLITYATYKTDSQAWFKDNRQAMLDLQAWMKNTKREL
ncbi:tetratricopeptide repeat protein [Mucilaginibacter sp. AW1-3]